jgi:hypothetical protein
VGDLFELDDGWADGGERALRNGCILAWDLG